VDLENLRIFSTVASLRSFTRAAAQLGLPKSRISTAVQQLEAQFGTRLLHRTTRSVRLSHDGEQCLERAQALLAEADELASLFQQSPAQLRGRLRVDMPNILALRVVLPQLPAFLARHPLIELELSTTDRRVDLVHEGFDCVLRVGPLHDSGLVARPLGHMRQLNVASASYLAQHGTPLSLADLAGHRLVRYASTLGAAPMGFEYFDGERYRTQAMAGVITVNSSDAYQAACLAGLGLIQAPLLGLSHLLDSGELVPVLPHLTAEPLPVSLLVAQRRALPRRLQVFMAWLQQLLAEYLAQDAPVAPG
jgi:DNA-binding transcriptional LysR family regulator